MPHLPPHLSQHPLSDDSPSDIPASLRADMTLHPTIQPGAPLAQGWENPTAVFLTGATGFLGAYLVQELMARTQFNFAATPAAGATIYYLSRQATPEEATARLIQQLRAYRVWQAASDPAGPDWEEALRARLVPVLGDLARPRLGLTERDFAELADKVQVIFHNGSWVNNLHDYEKLKPTNVGGTHEILRLATLRQLKPLHFISSMAIFFSAAHPPTLPIQESTIPRYSPTLRGGYTLSKWVADRLMGAAQERGLPVAIYRPVRVGGHSQTGVSKVGQDGSFDLLNTLIQGAVELGLFPDLAVEIPLVPVDYVSSAVVQLAAQQDSWGQAFHLVNHHPMQWAELHQLLCDSGYALEKIPYGEWVRAVKHKAASLPPKSLFGILQLMLTTPNNLQVQRPPFVTERVQDALAAHAITCPPLDRRLMALYLRYFQQVGYLPAPQAAPRSSESQ
jgi:thioester reductase-like protein